MSDISESDAMFAELTANVISAYVSKHNVPASELTGLISTVHDALRGVMKPAEEVTAEPERKPAVSVKKSVKDHEITCLDCGHSFKSLKRHLMTHHSLTPEQYRDRWGLADDYPMVAPEYAKIRSRLARESGLGQHRTAQAAAKDAA